MRKHYYILCGVVTKTNHQYISQSLIDTLILAEDKRYLYHLGFDPISVIRAISSLLIKRKLQGASTIEQQFIRTITRRYEITLSRKLREILLAFLISASFSKEQIARAYLCVAYFGWQMNGIKQACRRLAVNPQTATVAQSSQIIARLKYPEQRNTSFKRMKQIQDRAAYILELHSVSNNKHKK